MWIVFEPQAVATMEKTMSSGAVTMPISSDDADGEGASRARHHRARLQAGEKLYDTITSLTPRLPARSDSSPLLLMPASHCVVICIVLSVVGAQALGVVPADNVTGEGHDGVGVTVVGHEVIGVHVVEDDGGRVAAAVGGGQHGVVGGGEAGGAAQDLKACCGEEQRGKVGRNDEW